MPNDGLEKIILLVDDSEDDALLLTRRLSQSGLRNRVIWLASGSDALAYLAGDAPYNDRAVSPFPTVLLLDLRMPGMDGFAVLEWIRTRPALRNLFIVALSGFDDTKSVQRAYALGANSYLAKPPNASDIVNLVKWFKGYWTIAPPPTGGNAPEEVKMRAPGDHVRNPSE